MVEFHFHIKLPFSHKSKSIKKVLRIETDKFRICEAKEIRKPKWLIGQEVWIVHINKNGEINCKKLGE